MGGWACGKAAKEERTLNSGGVLQRIKQSTKRHLHVRTLPALSGAAASLGSTRASMPASAHHRREKPAWPSLGGRANAQGVKPPSVSTLFQSKSSQKVGTAQCCHRVFFSGPGFFLARWRTGTTDPFAPCCARPFAILCAYTLICAQAYKG